MHENPAVVLTIVFGCLFLFGFIVYLSLGRSTSYGYKLEDALSREWGSIQYGKLPSSNLADSHNSSYYQKNDIRMYSYSAGHIKIPTILTVVIVPCRHLDDGVYSTVGSIYRYVKGQLSLTEKQFNSYPLKGIEKHFNIRSDSCMTCDVFEGFAFFHFQEKSLFGSESIEHAKVFAEQYVDEK